MTAAEHEEHEEAEHENDNGYEEAMKRLAVLKSMPVESLTEAERKEKLRLANRESARKMRRKQAEQLQAAEIEVHKLEAESADYMNKLAEGWHRYKEIKNENELLRGELQALQTLQATMAANGEDGTEGAANPSAEDPSAAQPSTSTADPNAPAADAAAQPVKNSAVPVPTGDSAPPELVPPLTAAAPAPAQPPPAPPKEMTEAPTSTA